MARDVVRRILLREIIEEVSSDDEEIDVLPVLFQPSDVGNSKIN
jgi:hypothetical protein